jgi:hypothetical protein
MLRGGDKFDGFSSCIPEGLANNSAKLDLLGISQKLLAILMT